MTIGCDPKPDSSLEQTDAPRLRFDSHEAALNFATHGVENANRWLTAHASNIADHYENLNLEVVVRCRSMRDAHDFHLIFRCVPCGGDAKAADIAHKATDHHVASGHADRDNDFVFVGITKLVYRPENNIPSLVWLKRHHDIKDFFRQVFGAPFYSVLNFSSILTEREMGVLTRLTGSKGNRVSSLVEGGAQSIENIRGDPRETYWQGLSELDLMGILSSLSVRLNDSGVWITVDENGNLPFKILNTSLGMLDAVA